MRRGWLKGIAFVVTVALAASGYFFFKNKDTSDLKAPLQIGTINIDIIRENLPAEFRIRQDINEILKHYNEYFTKLEAELRERDISLRERSNGMNSFDKKVMDQLEAEKRLFEKDVIKLQKMAEEKKNDLDEVHRECREKIQKHLVEVVKRTANQKEMDIVFVQNNVLFIRPDLDITTQVLESLSQETDYIKIPKEKLIHGR